MLTAPALALRLDHAQARAYSQRGKADSALAQLSPGLPTIVQAHAVAAVPRPQPQPGDLRTKMEWLQLYFAWVHDMARFTALVGHRDEAERLEIQALALAREFETKLAVYAPADCPQQKAQYTQIDCLNALAVVQFDANKFTEGLATLARAETLTRPMLHPQNQKNRSGGFDEGLFAMLVTKATCLRRSLEIVRRGTPQWRETVAMALTAARQALAMATQFRHPVKEVDCHTLIGQLEQLVF